jgi:competence protein ComGC
MSKSFTLVECLVILFIISIMLNLSLNLLKFESDIKNKIRIDERGE